MTRFADRLRRATCVLASGPGLLGVGAAFGVLAALLQRAGNPANMGLCTAGFVRDIAGALGLHRDPAGQYLRPEPPALMLGAAIAAVVSGELKARASAAVLVHFVLGGLAMLGALAFQGCSLRALLRMAGGDISGVVGVCGFAAGVCAGLWFVRRGFDLGRGYPTVRIATWLPVLAALGLLALRGFGSGQHGLLEAGELAPATEHAPVPLAVAVGLGLGWLGQRSRFCTMGAVRDILLMRSFSLMAGLAGVVFAGLVTNLLLGQLRPGFAATPLGAVAGFLGMTLVGLASTLAGGCPTRQLFQAGEGNGDAIAFLGGMAATAALVHNWGFFAVCGSGPADVSAGGVGLVCAGLLVCVLIGLGNRTG